MVEDSRQPWTSEEGEEDCRPWERWSREKFGKRCTPPPPPNLFNREIEETSRDGFIFLQQPGIQADREDGSSEKLASRGSTFNYSGVIVFHDLLDLRGIDGLDSLKEVFSGRYDRESWNHATKALEAFGDSVAEGWEEIVAKVKEQVREKIRWEVFEGGDFPHDLDARSDVGATLFYSDLKQNSSIETTGRILSAKIRVDLTMYLWHKPDDNPRAALAKNCHFIEAAVAKNMMDEIEAFLGKGRV